MKIKLGRWTLENDVDVKCTLDGWEIFLVAVERLGIVPNDFEDADWFNLGSILVQED